MRNLTPVVKMIRQLSPASVVVALVLLWSPMPFGSVRVEHRSFLVAALAGVALVVVLFRRDLRSVTCVRLPALALVGVALLGWLQALPLPAGWVRTLSPEHWRLAQGVDEALTEASLSLAPSLSRAAALWWLTLALVLLISAALGRRRSERTLLLVCLAATGLFQVFYGVRLWLSRSREIWWHEVPGDPSRLRGTFVNANHLALYLELLLPIAFAWFWWNLRRAREEIELEARLVRMAPPALVWLILLLGLAFSGSRAGLIAACVATLFQGALLATMHRQWRLAPAGLLALAVGFGVLSGVGLQRGLGRLLATTGYEVTFGQRLEAYGLAGQLWLRHPWLGTGLASFREAFATVRPADFGETWSHLHNDYLELLMTTGIVGLGLCVLGLWPLVNRLSTVLVRGVRSADRLASLAALGALVSAATHSFFDFGLAIPANALALTVICGLAAGAPLRRQVSTGVIDIRRGDVRILERPDRRRRKREPGSGVQRR